MQLLNFFAQDVNGNIVPGATCTIFISGTSTLAAGLQDASGAPLSNPFNANSAGLVSVAAPQGIYDIQMVSGLLNYTIKVQFIDAAQVAIDASSAAASAAAASAASTSASESAIEAAIASDALRLRLANASDRSKGFAEVGTLQFGLGKPGDSTPVARGFWEDVGAGANIWRFRDRTLIGGAVDYNGTYDPGTGRSWVGLSAGGNMTYFDVLSQSATYSTLGGIAGAFASRTSDNTRAGQSNTIPVASFVDNDNANSSDKKGAWAFYGHAVHSQDNTFTACMEVDIANRKATVPVTPYDMGAVGTTAAHWIGTGGETAQAGLSVNPASVAVAIVSTGTRDAVAGTGALFEKGIVFQADALSGCNGVSGRATAIQMARGHQISWLTPTNGVAANIRSENTATSSASSLFFGNSGIVFRGLKADLTTENNLFAITTNPSAVNYIQVGAGGAGSPVAMSATGSDTDIDFYLQPKGAGKLRVGTTVTNAAVAGNFSAQQILAFKDASGTIYYIPCRAATW